MEGLADRIRSGDTRALARTITYLESGAAAGQRTLADLRRAGAHGHVVGITGAPGSGKSTLTDKLIEAARARDERVAVVAVDPSSPYTGGAVLGDRIRMMRWHDDAGVYIRSMATRGHLGGLAAASLQVVALLDAAGFDRILLETVGVGQSEVDIVRVADTTVLVLTPGAGDAVQAFKAGVMEIADVFVVNKFDLPGGPRLKREIHSLLELDPDMSGWRPPVLEAVAAQSEGTDALMEAIDAHAAELTARGALGARRRERAAFELSATVGAAVRAMLEAHQDELVDAILAGELTAAEAVRRVLPSAAGADGVARPDAHSAAADRAAAEHDGAEHDGSTPAEPDAPR